MTRVQGYLASDGTVGYSRFGSISADPVVDLDGRKQSASLSGAESDLDGRRSRPSPDIRRLNVPAGRLTLPDYESHGLTVHRPEMTPVDATRHGLQEAVRAVWHLASESTEEV